MYDMGYRMDIHPMRLIIDMIARLYYGVLGYLQISSNNTLMYRVLHQASKRILDILIRTHGVSGYLQISYTTDMTFRLIDVC